jgi:hypothetical protein
MATQLLEWQQYGQVRMSPHHSAADSMWAKCSNKSASPLATLICPSAAFIVQSATTWTLAHHVQLMQLVV